MTNIIVVYWYLEYTEWFDTCIHYERSPTIELINTPIASYVYLFVWGRTPNFYSLSKFQLYTAVWSTIVIMLYIRSSDLTHLVTESLYPFTRVLATSPWQPLFYCTFCFYEFKFFFQSTYKWYYAVFVWGFFSVWFNSLNIMSSSFIQVTNDKVSFSFF